MAGNVSYSLIYGKWQGLILSSMKRYILRKKSMQQEEYNVQLNMVDMRKNGKLNEKLICSINYGLVPGY